MSFVTVASNSALNFIESPETTSIQSFAPMQTVRILLLTVLTRYTREHVFGAIRILRLEGVRKNNLCKK